MSCYYYFYFFFVIQETNICYFGHIIKTYVTFSIFIILSQFFILSFSQMESFYINYTIFDRSNFNRNIFHFTSFVIFTLINKIIVYWILNANIFSFRSLTKGKANFLRSALHCLHCEIMCTYNHYIIIY